ncbi:MAG: class I mannose-6-phosphate isomerase, partial [Clostridia bacterium]|nr:class I mannose-6-phosphate isomerase [Clostridia bacterium]
KNRLAKTIRFRVDANDPETPRLIPAPAYEAALDQTSEKPFRMQAYYDPSVWGGQWMKRVFDLSPDKENYGWSFDGVPEENCIKFRFGTDCITFPAINLVHSRPEKLLGEHVFGRFGAEFPIRFDFLDTMEGGNLSLQVHPLTGYIQEKFGMHYTQDESYYILDATEESSVYLGVKPGMDLKAFEAALRTAQAGGTPPDVEQFINHFPVRKHDHVLIPAGTVHCSGKDTVVLEISATPYIFTFKLWDWGRIGLDGLPRPVHIDHGIANIQTYRDTAWVEANLLNQEKIILKDDAGIVEHTGLHNLEFIETERHTVKGRRVVDTYDSVNVLNLVDGREARIESVDGSFPPSVIHYSETFIIPASVKQYVLKADQKVMLICARVR